PYVRRNATNASSAANMSSATSDSVGIGVVAAATMLVVLALSLPSGSPASEVTVAVFAIGAVAVGATFTVSVNVNVAPAATVGAVQVTVPFVPAGGVVQLKLPGASISAKVVFAGRMSVNVTLVASLGPALDTTIV